MYRLSFVMCCLFIGVYSGEPIIFQHPINVTVSPGEEAEFRCKGTGNPTPNIMLIKEDSIIDVNSLSTQGSLTSTSVVSVIRQFSEAQKSDEGWYVCVVSNVNGIEMSRAYLEVRDVCKNVKCPKRQYCHANRETGEAECRCLECSENARYKPVCASNCQTYYNKCSMISESCQTNSFLRVEHKGECAPVQEVEFQIPSDPVELFESETLTLTCGITSYPEPSMVKWVKILSNGKEKTVSESGEHLVQSVRQKDAGRYRCVARQCNKKFKSEEVEVIVNSNTADDPVPATRTCKVFGDPHITNFDGKRFDYNGKCNYVLAMDCVNMDWWVFGQFMPCGANGVTCLESLTIYFGSMRPVSVARGWIVGQDGTKHRLRKNKPLQLDDMQLEYTGLAVDILLTSAGVRIMFDGFWGVQITAPPEQLTCGLCGNNNGNSTDDFLVGRSGNTGNDIKKFSESWSLNGGNDWCEEDIPGIETECENIEEVRDTCSSIVESEPFSECIKQLDSDVYQATCMMDVCNTSIERYDAPIECVFANTLAQHCLVAGFNVPANFFQQIGCGNKSDIQEAIYNAGCPLDGNPPFLD